MEAHDTGVLAATTAFGKTVLASWLIARRGVNALILVHRQQLLDQWIERLSSFLDLPAKSFGRLGGGRKKLTGQVDVALIQSLVRKGIVHDCVSGYGHIIVDECHHLPARSFELVMRRAKGRYVLGLSASVTRKDGHHPILFMQCGPVRYRVNARQQAARRPFAHHVMVRPTAFRIGGDADPDPRMEFSRIYGALALDSKRNEMICADVIASVRAGRFPLLLTERTEHLQTLGNMLSKSISRVITLQGGMGKKEMRTAMASLAETPGPGGQVLIATGKYIGEGFDEPRLDSCF